MKSNEKVHEEKRKKAVEIMDASRAKTRGVKFDSTEVVRRMRDARYFWTGYSNNSPLANSKLRKV